MPIVDDGFSKDPAGTGNLSSDDIIGAFSGTPDGTKFLRDDGTLAVPSGGGGGYNGTKAGNSGTAAITLTAATNNILQFNQAIIAGAAYHDPTGVAQANSRLVAPTTETYELYLVVAPVYLEYTSIRVFLNGGSGYSTFLTHQGPFYISTPTPYIFLDHFELTAGDYLEVALYFPSGTQAYYPYGFTGGALPRKATYVIFRRIS